MAFIRHYWRVLEPETELIEGWALYAIILHLEAVTFGEMSRLLITVPPGFMKSLCTDVFWPAWEWGPMGKAHRRYVAFSYSASLTERDNERFRDLVTHSSYQELWGDKVQMVKIGATKQSNRKHGWKLASSVGGVGTGERADVIILDDAHNIKEVESEVVRTETVRWFRESMSDRLNSMATGSIVVIMQRSHEDDVAGAILSLGLPYTHLMIPMEYDAARHCVTDIWEDPREDDGELAWPERFPPEVVKQLRDVKGPYAYAGQYGQSPVPRGGGIFQRDWWKVWDAPDGKFPVFDYIIASLDSSFTAREENDPSALTIWGLFTLEGRRRCCLIHAWRKHLAFSADRKLLEPHHIGPRKIQREDGAVVMHPGFARWRQRTMEHWGLMEWVNDTCEAYKTDKLLIEAKASGISAAQELQNRFGRKGWSIQLCNVKGDKLARALAVQPSFSQGLIYAPALDWADTVIDEMSVFPKGKYDDLTDSATQALKYMRDVGMLRTDEEVDAEATERVTHHGRKHGFLPLYPSA
jgi:predicted phage terminase large subunit-like protein